MACLRVKIFLKVPRPLLRAMPTFKVPCPPFKQSFDGAILTLRFDNYWSPICIVVLWCHMARLAKFASLNENCY